MDIRAGVIAAFILALLGAMLALRAGVRTLQAARKLTFYRLRRERNASAWRTLGFAVVLILLTLWLSFYGESVAYRYFPPSPTPSLTLTPSVVPSITLSPTITLTPTITDTPLYTDTPTITPTPFIPPAIEALFESVVTPNPGAVFSPLQFTRNCSDFFDFEAATVFQNPINYMCAIFTYDQMLPGVQWTALWYRNGELVHYETKPWDGTTGGYGYADWRAPADEWLPGTYEVQVFVGLELKVVGQFILQGDAPTVTPTISPTATITPSPTRTPSPTPTSTRTPLPSPTLKPTNTPPPTQP